MVTRSKYIEDLKALVRPYLPEYLKEHAVTPGTHKGGEDWYHCINPDHDDSDPSMHFVKDSKQTRLYCFSCHAAYDIFHAAHIFEKKPIEGKGFFNNNLYYLADKFKIPYERPQLTDEELLHLRIQNTYEDVLHTLRTYAKSDPDVYYQHTRVRRINDDLCSAMGVGTMAWNEFLSAMNNKLYSEGWLKFVGINADYIGLDFITFVLKDHEGSAVGLARRWVAWTKQAMKKCKESGDTYLPKYKNTDESKCPIFRKDRMLYGISRAHEESCLDLVEGYMDQLAMVQAGNKSVAAICGSSLTNGQVEVIKDMGYTGVNLVLDSDPAGISAMEKYLKSLRGVRGITPTITILGFEDSIPESERDPCTWIQLYGFDMYKEQPRWAAFDWELGKLIQAGVSSAEIAHSMVDYIAAEPSQIEREMMINTLSVRTGIDRNAIASDVIQHTTDKLDALITDHMRKCKRASTVADKVEILKQAASRAAETISITSKDELSVSHTANIVRDITRSFMKVGPGLPGWNSGIQCINEAFGGIPKKKELIGFAGNPNTGKSSLLYNICHGLLTHDNPNLCCVFWTLDDPVETFIAKLLAIKSGHPINHCRWPMSYGLVDQDGVYDTAYMEAIKWISHVTRSGMLIPRGVEIGNKIQHCEKLLKSIQDETGKQLVVFVDSFHSIGGDSDLRLDYREAALWMQKISDIMDLTFICSFEPTKSAMTGGKASMASIGETAKIQFAFKLIGIVHNDLHERREKATMTWEDNGVTRPIIEINYEKNKITAFKGKHYFKFTDDQALLTETSMQAIEADMNTKHNKAIESFTGVTNVQNVTDWDSDKNVIDVK